MKQKGYLLVISAPSGAGKSTLIHKLRNEFPEIQFSISTTTREPREGEQNGVDYHFVNKKTFQNMIDAGEFIEWAHIHGHLYGTSLFSLTESLAQDKVMLLDVDIQGVSKLQTILEDIPIYIFIVPPSFEVLKYRLQKRGTETSESLNIRLSKAKKEINSYENYDYIVINDDLETAYSELRSIYLAGKYRTLLRRDFIEEYF